jgi:hypothetical protein
VAAPPERGEVIHFRIRYEQLRAGLGGRRRREGLLRAAWLGLGIIGLAAPAWGAGWLGPWPWLWPAAAVGLFMAATARMARPQAASELGEELDRRFGLDDLLVTAVEVDLRGPASPLEVRLLDDAATALARIERDPLLRGPGVVREAEALVGVAAAVVGAWLLAIALGGAALGPALPQIGLGDPGGGTGAAGSPGRSPDEEVGAAEFIQALSREGEAESQGARGAPEAGGPQSAGLNPSGDLRVGTPAARLNVAAAATEAAPSGDPGSGAAVSGGAGEAQTAGSGAEGRVAGGGGPAPGAPGGGGATWEHREAVRLYFDRP